MNRYDASRLERSRRLMFLACVVVGRGGCGQVAQSPPTLQTLEAPFAVAPSTATTRTSVGSVRRLSASLRCESTRSMPSAAEHQTSRSLYHPFARSSHASVPRPSSRVRASVVDRCCDHAGGACLQSIGFVEWCRRGSSGGDCWRPGAGTTPHPSTPIHVHRLRVGKCRLAVRRIAGVRG